MKVKHGINHSEGPWIIDFDEFDGYAKIIASDGTVILGLSPDLYDCARGDIHLISAAPDMLEALKNIENDYGEIPDTIWDMRNAAIAKAEGRDII